MHHFMILVCIISLRLPIILRLVIRQTGLDIIEENASTTHMIMMTMEEMEMKSLSIPNKSIWIAYFLEGSLKELHEWRGLFLSVLSSSASLSTANWWTNNLWFNLEGGLDQNLPWNSLKTWNLRLHWLWVHSIGLNGRANSPYHPTQRTRLRVSLVCNPSCSQDNILAFLPN